MRSPAVINDGCDVNVAVFNHSLYQLALSLGRAFKSRLEVHLSRQEEDASRLETSPGPALCNASDTLIAELRHVQGSVNIP